MSSGTLLLGALSMSLSGRIPQPSVPFPLDQPYFQASSPTVDREQGTRRPRVCNPDTRE